MKKCLQCQRTYGDDLAFCLNDGSVLVESFDGESLTGVSQNRKSSGVFNYILVALIAGIFAGGVVAAIFFGVNYSVKKDVAANPQTNLVNGNSNKTNANSPQSVEINGTQKPSEIPKIAPKPTATTTADYFQVVSTSDGFTSIRATPSSKSAELGKLNAGTKIQCQNVVTGEKIGSSSGWRYCPSVGGYVFSKLLTQTY